MLHRHFCPDNTNSPLRGAEAAADPRAAEEKNEPCVSGDESDALCRRHHLWIFLNLYLGSPSVAGVQGGCVVLLYTLIHAQVACSCVADLQSKCIFPIIIFYFFLPNFFEPSLFPFLPLRSPRRRTRCCCISSSLGKRCPGTTQSFYTAGSSSERPSGRRPHNRSRGSARAGLQSNLLGWKNDLMNEREDVATSIGMFQAR